MTMISTRSNWLRFGAFLAPPASSLQFHWPLATDHRCHAPCPTPQGRAGQVVRRPFPAGCYLTPTADLAKTERGPGSTSGPSFSLCAEPGDSIGQIHPVLSIRRRSPVGGSLLASGFRRACRMAISRNACPFPALSLFPLAPFAGKPYEDVSFTRRRQGCHQLSSTTD